MTKETIEKHLKNYNLEDVDLYDILYLCEDLIKEYKEETEKEFPEATLAIRCLGITENELREFRWYTDEIMNE